VFALCSLEGWDNSRFLLFATASPADVQYASTLRTLQFAALIRDMPPPPVDQDTATGSTTAVGSLSQSAQSTSVTTAETGTPRRDDEEHKHAESPRTVQTATTFTPEHSESGASDILYPMRAMIKQAQAGGGNKDRARPSRQHHSASPSPKSAGARARADPANSGGANGQSSGASLAVPRRDARHRQSISDSENAEAPAQIVAADKRRQASAFDHPFLRQSTEEQRQGSLISYYEAESGNSSGAATPVAPASPQLGSRNNKSSG